MTLWGDCLTVTSALDRILGTLAMYEAEEYLLDLIEDIRVEVEAGGVHDFEVFRQVSLKIPRMPPPEVADHPGILARLDLGITSLVSWTPARSKCIPISRSVMAPLVQ